MNCGIYRMQASSKDMQGAHDEGDIYFDQVRDCCAKGAKNISQNQALFYTWVQVKNITLLRLKKI